MILGLFPLASLVIFLQFIFMASFRNNFKSQGGLSKSRNKLSEEGFTISKISQKQPEIFFLDFLHKRLLKSTVMIFRTFHETIPVTWT